MRAALSEVLERDHLRIDAGIERGHAGATDEADRRELAAAVEALRHHIYVEEELLFPRLREAGMAGPIMVMLREHAQMWPILDLIDEQLAGEVPADPLPKSCRQLTVLLQHHNPKEERILYPEADAVIAEALDEEIRMILVSQSRLEGWVCRNLRGIA